MDSVDAIITGHLNYHTPVLEMWHNGEMVIQHIDGVGKGHQEAMEILEDRIRQCVQGLTRDYFDTLSPEAVVLVIYPMNIDMYQAVAECIREMAGEGAAAVTLPLVRTRLIEREITGLYYEGTLMDMAVQRVRGQVMRELMT